MSRRRNLVLVPLVLAGLVACSSDDTGDGASDAGDAPTTAVTPGDSEPTTADDATTAETEETDAPATASGSQSTTSASSDSSGEQSDFCAPMEELANYNAESGVPDVSGDWDALQDELLERADEGLGLYDDAIAAAPDEVRGNLETLRDYSREVVTAVEDSSSFDEFLSAFTAPSSDVEQATLEVNTYISQNCGFELTETQTTSTG